MKSGNTNDLVKKFSAYLSKQKSKLPVESVKAWVEARYDEQLLGAKKAHIENAFSLDIADQTHKLISSDELKKFAVKSVVLTLMFLEMALIDTKIDILGVAYELV